MADLTPEEIADLGRAILQQKSPLVTVTPRAVHGLLDTNALTDLTEPSISAFFTHMNVLAGSEIEAVRVSLTALTESLPTDVRPYGERRYAGIDFQNGLGLSKAERREAWTGVWPISARNLAIAARDQLPLLGAVRSYISPKTARIITGSALDLTTGRHWIETRKMTTAEKSQLFPEGSSGAWIAVKPGPVAALERL